MDKTFIFLKICWHHVRWMWQVPFPKLQNLLLFRLDSLTEIRTSAFQLEPSFPQLRELRMQHLLNLMHVWNMGSCETIRFCSLCYLHISLCPVMKVVATTEKNATTLIEFPFLQTLVLMDLSNFKGFHMGISPLFNEKVCSNSSYIYIQACSVDRQCSVRVSEKHKLESTYFSCKRWISPFLYDKYSLRTQIIGNV